jgi:uncharacterized protein YjiS (DUF1127 family)
MYDGTNHASVSRNSPAAQDLAAPRVTPEQIDAIVRRAQQMRAAAIGAWVADLVAKPALRYRQWRAARAAVRELESLDDRMLADIGITREQIRALTHAAPHVAAQERGAMLVDFVRARLVEPFKRWRARSRTRQELSALDDAMLRDIGIERGQIDGIAAAVAEGKLARPGTPVPVGLALGFLDLPQPANSNQSQPRPALVTDAAD